MSIASETAAGTLGTLKREIAEGKLCLKADGMTRFRFEFWCDGGQIGCYAIRSTAPFEIRLERAWNRSRMAWDTTRKMFVPSMPQRRFGQIKQSSKILIKELSATSDTAIDVVELTFQALAIGDGDTIRDAKGDFYCFEVADLQGVKFNG